MPGGVLHEKSGSYISDSLLSILRQADIRIGTLETAVGNNPSFYGEKMSRRADVIYVKDNDLKRLVELDINIVSLANNHFFDLGPIGAVHALDLLDSLGIQHCGAGRNLEEASQPVVVEKDGKSIAFLAFCDWRDETVGWCPFATDKDPGVNPMYDEYVINEITKYKRIYDYIAVIPHWGKEHTFVTTRHVYRLAKKMIKAGADMIFGGHTHRIQPLISRSNKIIAYSMGNFLFPDRIIVSPRSTFYPNEPIDISTLPITDRYPFVKEMTLKRWAPLARIGMAVITSINENRIMAKPFFVHLDSYNVLTSYSIPLIVKIPLLWQYFLLILTPYAWYEFLFSHMKRFIKRLFVGNEARR